MNLQEKYNEYKQRQEAKKFFNQNNDYHLSISDYIKMFVVGTVIAIFSTIAFDFLSMKIGWSFSYFDILTGYFTGSVVLKIARYGSEKVGIISAVCYLLGTLFTPMLTYSIFWNQSVSLVTAIQLALGQISDLFSLVFIAVGAMTAYLTSKN